MVNISFYLGLQNSFQVRSAQSEVVPFTKVPFNIIWNRWSGVRIQPWELFIVIITNTHKLKGSTDWKELDWQIHSYRTPIPDSASEIKSTDPSYVLPSVTENVNPRPYLLKYSKQHIHTCVQDHCDKTFPMTDLDLTFNFDNFNVNLVNLNLKISSEAEMAEHSIAWAQSL